MLPDEFIRKYLISLGASEDDIQPYPYLFYKLTGRKGKPRIFENPLKLFLLQFVIGTLFWGAGMYIFVWHFRGPMIAQFYSAIAFGVGSGVILAVQVRNRAQRLKLYQWEKWLKDKGFSEEQHTAH
ncbi:DUF6404 family protein [uncultured Photobacterium sp.]|uniref:DUF6404 family protein n=1 Tax=uncultured Photobacterium sp. TaxID=173973 RepID=UPI0026149A8C|nr:DUF6404 family protein [uncultured Photobacterium sp.]